MQSSQQLFRQCVKDVLEPLMDLASAKFKKKVRFVCKWRQFSVFSQGNSEKSESYDLPITSSVVFIRW